MNPATAQKALNIAVKQKKLFKVDISLDQYKTTDEPSLLSHYSLICSYYIIIIIILLLLLEYSVNWEYVQIGEV